jgi:hypothetical protein
LIEIYRLQVIPARISEIAQSKATRGKKGNLKAWDFRAKLTNYSICICAQNVHIVAGTGVYLPALQDWAGNKVK